jgi:cytochrome c-type biogenesis protein CcmE
MKTRQKRIWFVVLGFISLSLAAALILSAFRKSLVFFVTPSQVAANEVAEGRNFRIGGLVEKGSLRQDADGLTSRFIVTDNTSSVHVVYKGILPDLFKEGRGCVAQGKVAGDGVFYADLVLAKHDENYMPPVIDK